MTSGCVVTASQENVRWLLAEMQSRAALIESFFLTSPQEVAQVHQIELPIIFIPVGAIGGNELVRLARCGRHVGNFVVEHRASPG